MLYKYTQKEKDVCIFPFIKKIGKISIKKELDNIMIKKLKRDKLLWNYKGYIENLANGEMRKTEQISCGGASSMKYVTKKKY